MLFNNLTCYTLPTIESEYNHTIKLQKKLSHLFLKLVNIICL